MYTGKEVCQGCNKSGAEKHRYHKNSLCDDCVKALKIGLATKKESSIKYVNFFQHYYSYNDDVLNKSIHDFLKSMHMENVNTEHSNSLKYYFGSNGKQYSIDKRLFIPIQNLFNTLEKRIIELKKNEEMLLKKVKKEVEKERDRIYNEGIIKGRNLLFQLNEGVITSKDLEANYSYNSIYK